MMMHLHQSMADATTAAQGRCEECGELNPYLALTCHACTARLPWADALEAVSAGKAHPLLAAPAPGFLAAPSPNLAAPPSPSGQTVLPPPAPTLVTSAVVAPSSLAPQHGTSQATAWKSMPAAFLQAPHPSPGSPMLVRVTAQMIDWPYACACCGQSLEGPSAIGHKVLRASAGQGQVPYCATCARHAELANAGDNTLGCCLLLAAFGLLPFFLLFQSLTNSILWGLGGAMLCSAALAWLGLQVQQSKLQEAQALVNAGCCDVRYAVVSKDGDDKSHSFLFKRPEYAEAFMRANSQQVMAQP